MTLSTIDTLIIGAGQSGLAAAYYLQKAGREVLVIDSGTRIGDSWRQRWDSLTLFTPRSFSHLPGLKMNNQDAQYYPTKDEMASYLEKYAQHFALPVELSTTLTRLSKKNGVFTATTSNGRITAKNVIIATGPFQTAFTPKASRKLSKTVEQLHTSRYDSPHSIKKKQVTVIGGGNSAAQLAVELSATKDVTVVAPGSLWFVPKTILGISVYWYVKLTGILSAPEKSFVARYMKRRGDSIVGAELKQLIAQKKVRFVSGRVIDARKNTLITDTRVEIHVESVLWATGFTPSYPWLTINRSLNKDGSARQKDGVSAVPGLYWLGLPWQTRVDSSIIHGAGHDARHIVRHIVQ